MNQSIFPKLNDYKKCGGDLKKEVTAIMNKLKETINDKFTEEGEKIISDSEPDEIKQVEVEQPNAFDVKSDGNIDINEDIKYEPPKEYTGVKTEVLDLSDINKEE